MNASEGTGKITSAANMTSGFLLFPVAEELDCAGPWEMFSIWSAYADGPKCLTVSESGGEVRCAKGLRMNADVDFGSCPKLGVLLVPGGEGVNREVENGRLIEFVRKRADTCRHLLAVCTGRSSSQRRAC